jgi:hypothetical protein
MTGDPSRPARPPTVTLPVRSWVRNCVIHDQRRTVRSLMSRTGVPSDYAERCLGHVIGGVRGFLNPADHMTTPRGGKGE